MRIMYDTKASKECSDIENYTKNVSQFSLLTEIVTTYFDSDENVECGRYKQKCGSVLPDMRFDSPPNDAGDFILNKISTVLIG